MKRCHSVKEYLVHILHMWYAADLFRKMHVIAAHDGEVLREMVFPEHDALDVRADHVGYIQRTGMVVAKACCHKQRDIINAAEADKLPEDRRTVLIPD